MTAQQKNRVSLPQKVVYWIIKIWSLIVIIFWVVLLFMMLTISEDFTPRMIPLIISGIAAVICLVISWRWMYWGGIAVTVSAIPVWVADWYLVAAYRDQPQQVSFGLSVLGLPLIVTGILLLLTYHYHHKMEHYE